MERVLVRAVRIQKAAWGGRSPWRRSKRRFGSTGRRHYGSVVELRNRAMSETGELIGVTRRRNGPSGFR